MKITLDDDEFKNLYLEGKLVIDCLEITLTQNSAEIPRIYKLAGSLFVKPENGVEARLVWERDANHPHDPIGWLIEQLSVRSGAIFPKDHYFSLQAVDTAGRTWTNPAVFLKREELQQAEILIVSCDFIQVRMDTPDPRTLVHFVFHDDLGIPMNTLHSSIEPRRTRQYQKVQRLAAKGIVDSFEIDYYPVSAVKVGSAHELSAVAKSGASPPTHFDIRLLEAIQFSVAKLARPIMWELLQDGQQTITLSKYRPFNNGYVEPPVPEHADADFYRLIEHYYQYACSEVKDGVALPLSKKIGGLFTLNGVWLGTIALLLAVTIESLLNEPIYKKLGAPSDEVLRKIDELIDHVNQGNSLDPILRKRAENILLSGLKSISASDRLHILTKVGVIDDKDIKAWKSIRHSAAHGGLDVDSSELQGLLDRVNRLVVIMYKLVFLRIGYQGAYTDYATQGWPPGKFDADLYKSNLDTLSQIQNKS